MYGSSNVRFDINNPPNFVEIYEIKNHKAIQHQSLPGKSSQSDKIMVALHDGSWYWIPNKEQITTIHRCNKLPGRCLYHTDNLKSYQDHLKSCKEETTIQALRRTYGPPSDALDMAISKGLIPNSFKDYRQKFLVTWDIETLEVETDLTSIQQAVHKVASIAVASNLPLQHDKFFIRESSAPEHGQKLVDEFLDELFRLESCFYETIPDEIKQAREILRNVNDDTFSKERTQRQVLKRFIENYFNLPVYGFNSGMSLVILYLSSKLF